MTTARAERFPPEAGACSDERRRLDLGVLRALCKLCWRARPIQIYHKGVVVKLHAVGAVLELLSPELAKVSLNAALSIFNRNVKAYEPTKRTRGSADPVGACRLPTISIEKERPSLLVFCCRQGLVWSH